MRKKTKKTGCTSDLQGVVSRKQPAFTYCSTIVPLQCTSLSMLYLKFHPHKQIAEVAAGSTKIFFLSSRFLKFQVKLDRVLWPCLKMLDLECVISLFNFITSFVCNIMYEYCVIFIGNDMGLSAIFFFKNHTQTHVVTYNHCIAIA